MNHDDLQVWLDAYVDAWRSYDPAAIGPSSRRMPPTPIIPMTRATRWYKAAKLSSPTG